MSLDEFVSGSLAADDKKYTDTNMNGRSSDICSDTLGLYGV